MACDCVEKMEQRLAVDLQHDLPAPITQVVCTDRIWDLGHRGPFPQLHVRFSVHADLAGYRSHNGKPVLVPAKFCAFCGTRYETIT